MAQYVLTLRKVFIVGRRILRRPACYETFTTTSVFIGKSATYAPYAPTYLLVLGDTDNSLRG